MIEANLVLRKGQRNDIFTGIQAAGLDPKEFELENGKEPARIKHKGSTSHFIVGDDLGYYSGYFVVGDGLERRYEASSWQSVVDRIHRWLAEVKQDLDTPDLWAILRGDFGFVEAASSSDTDNAPFNPVEEKEIVGRLRQLEEHAKSAYSLSEAQVEILGGKIDYLVEAAGHLGRKDWLNIFLGVVFSFVVASAIPPELLRRLFGDFLRISGHLFGLQGAISG